MNKHLVSNEVVKKISGRVNDHFRALSEIPRGSGNEKGISDFLVSFAEGLKDKGVTYTRSTHEPIDTKKIYDVVIRKPGTGECANQPVTILQAHMDMVCQKTEGSTHDFFKDPIEIQTEGNRMTAKDTTLGADDGIGVACILAILESDEISHPPIEALFTSDEEEDMTGAMAVSRDLLQGKRLINIDTETEGIFYFGCAGGINANFSLPVDYIPSAKGLTYYSLEISGLLGGHSGVEIDKKHANANRLLGRALHHLSTLLKQKGSALSLVEIKGGDKKNAITQAAVAIVGVDPAESSFFESEVKALYEMFAHEYEYVESSLKLEAVQKSGEFPQVFSPAALDKLLSLLMIIPNDVLAMHGKIPNLVETSCNMGVLQQEGDQVKVVSFIRSFIESKKQFVVEEMRLLADLVGAEFSTDADFPNWEPKSDSELIKRFQNAYMDTFEEEAGFESIHAGLECGHFAREFPEMDMIACGPTITGAHTTKETLYIDTVEKITHLLLNVLLQMQDEAVGDDLTQLFGVSEAACHSNMCQCII